MEEKDFVTLEIAQILKHKKVCIPFRYRRITKELKTDEVYEKGELVRFSWGDYTIPAPHLYDVQKWLREEHKIDVLICKSDRLNKYYPRNNEESYFDTYEEALNAGVKEALKLI